MKCVILAAGYATRLRPLTDDLPKHLLPVGERPMLEWVLDRVGEVEEVDATHLVTNRRFAPAFERWAKPHGVYVHDDGTTSNEDRLGAVGELHLVIETAGLRGDELLVLAGDNLFEFSLPRFAEWWRAKGRPASAVAAPRCRRPRARHALRDRGHRRPTSASCSFVEKPSDPPSTLASTLIYLMPAGARAACPGVSRRRP